MNLNWLQKIYDKLAFQKNYDKIKEWELPPKVDEAFDVIWENLSPAIKASLWKFIENIIKQYGEEKAKEILTKILPSFYED